MNKPSWYTDEHDMGWNRVKAAFANDWEQTKHDFGSKTARDLDARLCFGRVGQLEHFGYHHREH